MAAPYGDGLYAKEPPPGNGLNITDLFHIVDKKPDDPDINSAVDLKYPNVAIITFDRTNQFGGMWAKEQLDLTIPFSAEMYLHLGREYGPNTNIADGMTFTLHNDPAGINAIGGAGEGLGVYKGKKWTGGYWQGNPITVEHGTHLKNSLVVEFDTYRNLIVQSAFVDDPPGTAHCAVLIPKRDIIYMDDHYNAETFSPVQDWVRFAASWTPNADGGGTLSYTFGDIEASFLVLNIQSTFGGTKVYWGFTGATGQYTSVQAAAITRLPKQGVTAEKTVKNAAGIDINHGTVLPSEILTYSIRVTSLPLTSSIGPIIIEDLVSSFVEYTGDTVWVTTSAGGTYAGQTSYSSGLLSVNTTQRLAGEGDWIEISFNVRVSADTAGKVIFNYAEANADGLPEKVETNMTDVTVFAAPEKRVSTTSEAGKGGAAVKAGDRITYEIEYANYTDIPATIVITDELSPGLDFAFASDGGLYNKISHTVTWTLHGVPSGATNIVSMVVVVNEIAVIEIENYATVVVDDEPEETNIVVNPVIPNAPVKKVAGISEAGKDGSPVKSGDRITYEISYLNYTGVGAEITITDKLPIGVEYMSSNPEGAYNSNTRTVTWTILSMPSTGSGTVTVQVRVNGKATGQIINYATVRVGGTEAQNTNIVVNPIKGSWCAYLKQSTKCRMTISGRKIWEDNDNARGIRPPSVDIILIRDGEVYRSASVSGLGSGTYTFNFLPVLKNSSNVYEYKIDETDVPSYTKNIDGYNVINTLA